jgi:hypothetical protein
MTNNQYKIIRRVAREEYVANLRDGRKLRPATFKNKKKDADHRRHWNKEINNE